MTTSSSIPVLRPASDGASTIRTSERSSTRCVDRASIRGDSYGAKIAIRHLHQNLRVTQPAEMVVILQLA